MGITFSPGIGVLWGRNLIQAALRLFGRRDSAAEGWLDQRQDERGALEYSRIDRLNLNEIFSTRLFNLAADGATVSCDDEDVAVLISDIFGKSARWLPKAIGEGRVYLVPYITGGRVYTDIIGDSIVISTDRRGDDITGFVCVADTRWSGRRKYHRIAEYFHDADARTFTLRQKAVSDSGGEVPLSVIPEWAAIDPEIVFGGVDHPLFGVVDGARMARNGDKPDGVPITYGCRGTIDEIHECIAQYQREYKHKESVLAVDKSMIDTQNPYGATIKTEHVLSDRMGAMTQGGGDLFSVYSPDIRDAAYQSRLLELFGRLERQVGTSPGILTPMTTVSATATEIRRAFKDTIAMVSLIRSHVDTALASLAYAYSVMLDVVGIRASAEPTASVQWSDLAEDPAATATMWSQGNSSGVVSDAEYRRKVFFPSETEEEAEAAVAAIREANRQPGFEDFFPRDGGSNGDE